MARRLPAVPNKERRVSPSDFGYGLLRILVDPALWAASHLLARWEYRWRPTIEDNPYKPTALVGWATAAGLLAALMLQPTFVTQSGLVDALPHATASQFGPASPAAIAANICNNATYLQSPYHTGNEPAQPTSTYTWPDGTTVAAGSASNIVHVTPSNWSTTTFNTPNTTYYFAPGTYTNFGAIVGLNDWFIGEYSAGNGVVMNGTSTQQYGFEQGTTDFGAHFYYFEMKGYESWAIGGSGLNDGGSAPYNDVQHDWIHDNLFGVGTSGGVQIGSFSDLQYNCLDHNGDYDFQVYGGLGDPNPMTTGPQHVLVSHNEIARGDACNYEGVPAPYWRGGSTTGCSSQSGQGISGCAKFWETFDTTVTDNYVHDCYNVALWWDTNNVGEDVENNYLENNSSEAVMIEVSSNTTILHNTFNQNGVWTGYCGSNCGVAGVLSPAIYLSEVAAQTITNSFANDQVEVENNGFTNNWDGVSAYTDSDRYCGRTTQQDNWGRCTVADNVVDSPPSTHLGECGVSYPTACPDQGTTTYWYNTHTTGGGCRVAGTGGNLANATPSGRNPDYWDNCIWETTGTVVSNNQFTLDASAIDGIVGVANECENSPNGTTCGANGLFSYPAGTGFPPYGNLTYDNGYAVPDEIFNCTLGQAGTSTTFTGCHSWNNHFSSNTYSHTGTLNWQFEAWAQGTYENIAQWQAKGQDTGSTFS